MQIRMLGSEPLTSGSGCGSGRPKNIRILGIRMRIRNTATFTPFFKGKKVIKKSQNSRNQGFSYYLCLMIEGSGCRSVRPKNIRIRIRNTNQNLVLLTCDTLSAGKSWHFNKFLAHVELLPAGGGLHHGGVHAQLVSRPQDCHLHVPICGPCAHHQYPNCNVRSSARTSGLSLID